jgi:hypothetical protein
LKKKPKRMKPCSKVLPIMMSRFSMALAIETPFCIAFWLSMTSSYCG